MKTIVGVLFVMLLLGGSTATAQGAGDFDTQVLKSIDTVPDRAQLDAAWPDARQRLMRAAADDERGLYQRKRAVTLLSNYPDPQTRTFLQELAADEEPAVRKMAVYTAARTFGIPGDAALVAFVSEHLDDDSAEVREWAVRSLRWIAHDDARRLLERVLAGDREELKSIARRALRKRVSTEESSPTR